jgi:hypothetical protein
MASKPKIGSIPPTATIRQCFEAGFERACLLIFGNGVKWTPAERRIANRVTRKLFGGKRTPNRR